MLYLRRIFLVWVVVRGEWLSIESIRVPYRILAPGCYRMIAGNVPGSVPAVSYKVRNLLVLEYQREQTGIMCSMP